MTGLVRPSRSTSGNISFCTAVDAGYCRVPRPAAVITALRTLAMSDSPSFAGWSVRERFLHPEHLHQKRQLIRRLVDLFAGRFAGAVAGAGFDANEDRV